MSEIRQAITADLSCAMGKGRDEIILTAIRNVSATDHLIQKAIAKDGRVFSPELLESIAQRGRFEIYPDKTETFFWDNKPLIQFMPMEIKYEGNNISASQPYRLIVADSIQEGGEK